MADNCGWQIWTVEVHDFEGCVLGI